MTAQVHDMYTAILLSYHKHSSTIMKHDIKLWLMYIGEEPIMSIVPAAQAYTRL